MTVANLYPDIKPTLNLNFAKVKALDPRITFTRVSGAVYYDGVTHAKAEENLLIQSQNHSIHSQMYKYYHDRSQSLSRHQSQSVT
jgi:hypothetical protein